MQSSTRRSHDTLIDRGGIDVDKFTTPAINDGLNVFVTTADEPQTETVEVAKASPATTGTGVTLQREKATFATILSFVEHRLDQIRSSTIEVSFSRLLVTSSPGSNKRKRRSQ